MTPRWRGWSTHPLRTAECAVPSRLARPSVTAVTAIHPAGLFYLEWVSVGGRYGKRHFCRLPAANRALAVFLEFACRSPPEIRGRFIPAADIRTIVSRIGARQEREIKFMTAPSVGNEMSHSPVDHRDNS